MNPLTKKINVFILISLLFWGCASIKIKVFTKIEENGSCVRQIEVMGADSVMLKSFYPLPIGQNWAKSVVINPKDSSRKTTFSKTFSNPNLIIHNPNSDPSKLRFQPTFKSEFNWFSTEYIYQETIPCVMKYHAVPINKYLDNAELLVLYAKPHMLAWDTKNKKAILQTDQSEKMAINLDDSLKIENYTKKLENKLSTWIGSNILFETVLVLKKEMANGNNSMTTQDFKTIEQYSDSLASLIIENLKPDITINYLLSFLKSKTGKDIKIKEESRKEIKEICDYFFGVISTLIDLNITYTIQMPGSIISSNAYESTINGGIWEIPNYELLHSDYVIQIKSKTPNTSIAIATWGTVFILIIGLGFLVRKRKKG